MTKELVEVLVPIPLEGKFSYKIPSGLKNEDFQPGVRVEVPFGKRTLIGIVWGKDLLFPAQNHRNFSKSTFPPVRMTPTFLPARLFA